MDDVALSRGADPFGRTPPGVDRKLCATPARGSAGDRRRARGGLAFRGAAKRTRAGADRVRVRVTSALVLVALALGGCSGGSATPTTSATATANGQPWVVVKPGKAKPTATT